MLGEMSNDKVQVKCHGQADSTVQNRRSAIMKLNKYLKKHKCHNHDWAKLTKEEGEYLFCGSVGEYEGLATYLANECLPKLVKKSSDEGMNSLMEKASIAMSTAETYYGLIVQAARDRYSDHNCWNSTFFVESINKLRRNIKTVVIRYCIEKNIPLKKTQAAISRDEMAGIINAYLQCGETDYFQREGVYRSSVLVTSYVGVGRGGESSNVTWNNAKLHYEACGNSNTYLPSYFDLQWPAKKVGEYQAMAMSCDAKSWQLCWVNAYCRFLLAGGAAHRRKDKLDNSLFPHLKHKGGAASNVTTFLQDCLDTRSPFGSLQKVHPDIFARIDPGVTSTSIRRGTIRLLKRHKDITPQDLNYRSGHKDSSRCEEYDETEAVDTIPAMLALCGYDDVRSKCFLPNLRSISRDGNRVHLRNFSVALFADAAPPALFHDSQLQESFQIFLASTLMYFADWEQHLQQKDDTTGEIQHHVIVKKVLSVGKKLNISSGLIKYWGSEIKKDWININNTVQLAYHGENASGEVGENVCLLRQEVHFLKSELSEVKSLLQDLCQQKRKTNKVVVKRDTASSSLEVDEVKESSEHCSISADDSSGQMQFAKPPPLYVLPKDCP